MGKQSLDWTDLRDITEACEREVRRMQSDYHTLDIVFAVFLRHMSTFGYFSFGPINLDVRMIEDIVERTTPRGDGSRPAEHADDFVRFTRVLMEERRRSGRSKLDELHWLLAFMRCGEGLPQRVFSELGVTPEQVEEYARHRPFNQAQWEKLYSPEEAAEYLNVHVQTVRAWIRSGRLRARRLAGQRALRITASDLQSVLEPIEPGSLE